MDKIILSLIVAMFLIDVSAFTISPDVVLRSDELNTNINTTFTLSLDQLNFTDTTLTFYNMYYTHPLGCKQDFLSFFNYSIADMFVTTTDILNYTSVCPTANVTSISTALCRYKKFGYYNLKLPGMWQVGCV